MTYEIIKQIGEGSPRVAVVGGVHGDEPIGRNTLAALADLELVKGSIELIIAHPEAEQANKRFLETDLNRSFPGNERGSIEERLAKTLFSYLKEFDLVIDIHATNSAIDELVIVTKLDPPTREILARLPISKVALITQDVFGGNELIAQFPRAISLEYGPNKNGDNYTRAVRDITTLLSNEGLISGEKQRYLEKELYTVRGTYKVSDNFVATTQLADFSLIKKGDPLGEDKDGAVYSTETFYPLFCGKGRYEETLALMSQKESLVLN